MKKIVLKLHQILGSLLSLVFVVWFISGFVMLFSGFPHASKESLFNKQQIFIPTDSIQVLPNEFSANLQTVSLEKFNSKAIYRITDQDNNTKVIDAFTLTEIEFFSSYELDTLIQQNYNAGYREKKILSDFDAWIPWSHFKKYFPIHKYYLNDSLHTVAYASSKTGEIVQETNRKQRWLARFGAIPHWFYFKSLRLKKEAWIKLIVWISGIGSLMCLFGIVVGFYHFRKRNKRKRLGMFSFSPYKKRWYKWHHITGFFFGIITFTFVFSGMMSLQKVPKFIVPVKNEHHYIELWNKKYFNLNDFQLPVSTIIESERIPSIRKIEWCFTTSETPFYRVYSSDLNSPVMVSASPNKMAFKQKEFSWAEIEREFLRKIKNTEATFETLHESDGYYFEDRRPPFPVVKAVIYDDNKTWLYINPRDLNIVYSLNKNTRLRRWLYKGLHSFDFKLLVSHNTLRIVILFIISVFGTIISLSGVVLSYRYISRTIKKQAR